jgi:hypothetical protein
MMVLYRRTFGKKGEVRMDVVANGIGNFDRRNAERDIAVEWPGSTS